MPGNLDGGMSRAYIALGSNLGDREGFLRQALDRLDALSGVRVVRVSGLYETDPVGYTDQPAFLNAAAALDTKLSPRELLDCMLQTEETLGRKRDIRWGPRTVDLDLLTFGSEQIDTPELTLPHPRMRERPFVLIPLRDIIEETEMPELAEAVSNPSDPDGEAGVKRWKTRFWQAESGPSAN
jgi:2-amino-4-hydroxy-6-hydroxymethyldihydropteridine diphosphokinase